LDVALDFDPVRRMVDEGEIKHSFAIRILGVDRRAHQPSMCSLYVDFKAIGINGIVRAFADGDDITGPVYDVSVEDDALGWYQYSTKRDATVDIEPVR